MTSSLRELDLESVRLVLDAAYERPEALQLRPDDPRRVAFDAVAAAVEWKWYSEAGGSGAPLPQALQGG